MKRDAHFHRRTSLQAARHQHAQLLLVLTLLLAAGLTWRAFNESTISSIDANSVTMASQADTQVSPPLAAALWRRAQDLRSGPRGTADPVIERTLEAALLYASMPAARGLLHMELGEVHQKNRRFSPAQQHYDQAAEFFEAAAEPWLLAYARTRQGSVGFAKGQWRDGEALCREALATQQALRPEGSLEEVETLNCLGLILGQKPELEEAQALLERAIDLQLRLDPGSNALAHSYIQLAVVFRMQRAFESSDRLLERAYNLFLANQAPLTELAFALKQRGKTSHWANDFDKAEEYLERSLAAYEAAEAGNAQLAELHERLGKLALESGKLETVGRYARSALVLRQAQEAIDGDVGALANAHELLADYYEQKGLLHHAQAQTMLALAIRQQVASDFWVGYTHKALARIQTRLEDLDAARQSSDRALAHLSQGNQASSWLIEALTERGLLEEKAGDLALGRDWLRRAADALELATAELGSSRHKQAGFRSKFQDVYHHILETDVKLGDWEDAFLMLERSRAQSFLAMLAEHATVTGSSLPPALEARRKELQQYRDRIQYDLLDARRGGQVDAITRFEDETVDLQLEYERFQRRVREHQQQTILNAQAPVLDLDAVRHALDPGTLLISFSTLEDRILVFSTTRDSGLEVHEVDMGAKEVQVRVENLRWWIAQGRNGLARQASSLRSLAPQARGLYQKLLEPLQDRIDAAERLLIIPDTQLHVLPWAVLKPTEDRYLVEDKPLHLAPSASSYAQLKARHPMSEAPVLLAAFGGPEYPERLMDSNPQTIRDSQLRSVVDRGFSLQLLPYSELEVEGISRLFGSRARPYLGAAATEEQAKRTTGAKYLHFATHAIVDSRMPLHSALALTIPEQLEAEQDNGLLEVWEILESVRLDQTELVVLSSCESALGKELTGEGMIGLTRAFHIAGARSVVASLWSVQDDSTAELMRRFYQHLYAGLPKAEALRQAQIEMLRGDAGSASRMPFAWAAFQVYGDWE